MERLFVYGTLQPGQVNAYILENIGGEWLQGTVNGHYHASGWGEAYGFPALELDPFGPIVNGYIFSSERLNLHWEMLDRFEAGYQRVATQVKTTQGDIKAWVYQIQAKEG